MILLSQDDGNVHVLLSKCISGQVGVKHRFLPGNIYYWHTPTLFLRVDGSTHCDLQKWFRTVRVSSGVIWGHLLFVLLKELDFQRGEGCMFLFFWKDTFNLNSVPKIFLFCHLWRENCCGNERWIQSIGTLYCSKLHPLLNRIMDINVEFWEPKLNLTHASSIYNKWGSPTGNQSY